jgi:hypothetical protein
MRLRLRDRILEQRQKQRHGCDNPQRGLHFRHLQRARPLLSFVFGHFVNDAKLTSFET